MILPVSELNAQQINKQHYSDMKLHLPQALMLAVLSMGICENAVADSASGAINIDYSNYNAETERYDATMTITGPTSDYKPGYTAGIVGAISGLKGDFTVTAPEGSGITTDTRPTWVENSVVNMQGGSLCYLTGGANSDGIVYGDRTINMSGGRVNFLFGSDLILSDTKPEGGYFTSNPDGKPHVSGGNVSINISGGEVTHNLGVGVNFSGPSPLGEYIEANGGISAFAVKGDASITISGDAVIGGASMDEFNAAGGRYASVDGKLTVNIEGGTLNSDLYSGARGAITNADGSIDRSYVGSAEVNISGGQVNADVYGGNSYSGSGGGAGYTKGNVAINISGGTIAGDVYGGGDRDEINGGTKIVLSGGEVTGNVYGAGNKNTVKGSTEIVITGDGTKVDGALYGGGKDGAVVDGDRKLIIETESQLGTVGDFSLINVKKDTTIDKIENAADGTTLRTGAVLTVNSDLTIGSFATNVGQTDEAKLKVNGNLTVNGKQFGDSVNMVAYGQKQSIEVTGKTTIDTAGTSTISNKSQLKTGSLDIHSGLTLNNATIVADEVSVDAAFTILGGASVTSAEAEAPCLMTVNEAGSVTLSDKALIESMALNGGKVTVNGGATTGSLTLSEGVLTFDARLQDAFVDMNGADLTVADGVSIVLLVKDLDAVLDKEIVLFREIGTLDFAQTTITISDGTSSADLAYTVANGNVSITLPEPSTATLSLLALAALAARRRRK